MSKIKTPEEIIKDRFKFYNPDVYGKDVELNGETVIELMEQYHAQFTQPTIEQECFVWVKCKDKLPPIGWEGVVKWTDNTAYASFEHDGKFYEGNIYSYGALFESQPIEWLSPTNNKQEEANKWVKAERGYSLPDYDEPALWLRQDGNMFVYPLDKDDDIPAWLSQDEDGAKITHWMKLPELPKM